jgi:hypothetical protein
MALASSGVQHLRLWASERPTPMPSEALKDGLLVNPPF